MARNTKKKLDCLRSSRTPSQSPELRARRLRHKSRPRGGHAATNGSCLGLVILRPFLVVSHPGPWRWNRGVCLRDEADLSKPPSGEPLFWLHDGMAARLSLRTTGTRQQPATTASSRPQQRCSYSRDGTSCCTCVCGLASSSSTRRASNHATVAGTSPEVAVYFLPFGRSLGADILRMMRDLQVQLRKKFRASPQGSSPRP